MVITSSRPAQFSEGLRSKKKHHLRKLIHSWPRLIRFLEPRSPFSDTTISEKLERIRRRRRARNKAASIFKLPLDLIADIFEQVCDPDDDTGYYLDNLENLQLVCTTFRDIVIAMPRLWSLVDSSMGVERILLQITRSKDAPMSLRLLSSPTRDVQTLYCEIYSILKRYSERFNTAIVFIYIDEDTAMEMGRDKLSLLSGWDMAALSSLTFDATIAGDKLKVGDLAWRTPKLESLVCVGSQESIAFPFQAPLKEVFLHPAEWQIYDGENFVRLFSSVAKTLERIVINFAASPGVSFDGHLDDVKDVIPSMQLTPRYGDQNQALVKFPLLQHVRIALYHVDCTGDIFRLLERFDLSNAAQIEVTTYPGYRKELSKEEDSAFARFLEQQPTRRERSVSSHNVCFSCDDIVPSSELPIDRYSRRTYVTKS